MATIDDALELITDRQYAISPHSTDPVEIKTGLISVRLQQLGAADDMAARVLMTQAADRIGGQVRVDQRQVGLRTGPQSVHDEFRLAVPRRALRE